MMSAIVKRYELNRITSPSTFKPPPRVTLTDHKREAWLRDLATPTVPLRRLSRTIPHGIRSRVLVEQCCNKSVPIHRAVWFARCVGANELRGLKRKGTNATIADAEAQWVREWTVQLAGFLEKVLGECGQSAETSEKQHASQNSQPGTHIQSWKSRVDYTLQFSSYLDSEELIDRSYFLDWMITHLEKSAVQRTLLSLIVIRLFWLKLLHYPEKCKRLAEILLTRFRLLSFEVENTKTSHTELFQVLQYKVATFIWELLSYSSQAFIMPEAWQSNRTLLQKAIHLVDVEAPVADKAFEVIALANMSSFRQQSMLEYSGVSSRDTEEEQRERLIAVLHDAALPYDTDQIAEELILAASIPPSCFDGNDPRQLVDILCQWAICGLSAGTERIDLVTTVFKKWTTSGKAVFDALFSFFDTFIEIKDLNLDMMKKLLSSLVGKGVLLPDVYVRKLISRGIFLLPSMKQKVYLGYFCFFFNSITNTDYRLVAMVLFCDIYHLMSIPYPSKISDKFYLKTAHRRKSWSIKKKCFHRL